MPNYRYQVRSNSGEVQGGTLSAESANAAAAMLRGQGVRVMSLSPVSEGLGSMSILSSIRKLNERKPSQKHVLDFTTQMAVMIRAGINLRTALEGIADQTSHPSFRKVILQLKNDVESGKQFSDAVGAHPKLFGPLYVNMVRASEMSGSFADMLDRIAGYIGQQIETKKMVVGASIYPGVIGTLAIGVTVFLLTFVLPKFYAVFEGKEDVLPWATTFLMSVSKTLTQQWPIVVGVAAAGIIGLIFFLKTELGGFWADKAKLKVPVVRAMFKSLYISRGLQTMGQLINAGVPMLDTLAITGDVSGNRIYKGMWGRVYASVKQGKKIAAPLIKDAMLPKAVCQMISAGEESGKLGEVLDQISKYYAKQLKEHIKAATGLIEPVMILVMGTIVGFIAMAIILPIFKMSQIVK